jgi:hypothetical protein
VQTLGRGKTVQKAITFAFILAATLLCLPNLATDASARCFFLECEPGEVHEPPPRLEPPPPVSSTSPIAPQVARPTAPNETCRQADSYTTYCVSSVLEPQYGFTYGPEKLFDARLDTAWVEGDEGDGIGAWIIVEFSQPERLSELQLLNGYHKNRGIYQANNRIRDVLVRTSSGYQEAWRLDDSPAIQTIVIGDDTPIQWVQFVIQSVYRGSKYRDTAVTELRAVRRPN